MNKGDCCDKRGKPYDCKKLKRNLDLLDKLFSDLMDDWQKSVKEELDDAEFYAWASFASKVLPGAIAVGASVSGNAVKTAVPTVGNTVSKNTVATLATRPGMIPTAVSRGDGIKGIGAGAAETINAANRARNVGAAVAGAAVAGGELRDNLIKDGAGSLSPELSDVLAPFDKVTDNAINLADQAGNQFSDLAKSNRRLKNKFKERFNRCCKDK